MDASNSGYKSKSRSRKSKKGSRKSQSKKAKRHIKLSTAERARRRARMLAMPRNSKGRIMKKH